MIDKETLQNHLDSGMNMSQISRLYDVTPNSVKKWLKKYNLYSRKISYNGHNKSDKKYICKNCDEELKGKAKYTNIYCSNKCQKEKEYKDFIEKWKNGKEDGIRGYGTSSHLRRYLFEKYDNKCSKCGWSEMNQYTGKIPLEIEHLDGNSENNQDENLTLLCPCCHSLTSTYKGSNRGNGRHARRQRYKEGKSY